MNEKTLALMIDNASDDVGRISIFKDRNTTREVNRARYVAHVINLAVNRCLMVVRNELSSTLNSIGSTLCFARGIDLCDLVRKKTSFDNAYLPQLDVENNGLQLLRRGTPHT